MCRVIERRRQEQRILSLNLRQSLACIEPLQERDIGIGGQGSLITCYRWRQRSRARHKLIVQGSVVEQVIGNRGWEHISEQPKPAANDSPSAPTKWRPDDSHAGLPTHRCVLTQSLM